MPADDFSTLFEFLPVGAYRSSADGRQLRANPALVRFNGFASEAEHLAAVRDIGNGWYADPKRRADFAKAMDDHGTVLGFESEVYRYKTRERVWVSENAHVVRDAAGAVLYYEGTVEEITERVRERAELRASQEQLRQVLALLPGMVYRVLILPNGDRRATFVSLGSQALFGHPPEAVLADGLLIHRLRHPDDRARIEAETRAATAQRLPLQTEYRAVLDSGEVKWLQLISTSAPPEADAEVRVGVVFDITARKQAEQALQDSGALWKQALESSGDGVWDWQVRQGVATLSAQGQAMFGYADGEMPERPEALDRLTHPDDLPIKRQAREAHLAGRTPAFVSEHRLRCKDGQWKWVLSRGIIISRDAGGNALRMIGTYTDISAHKQAGALRLERDSAAAADRAKSQFLSRVSHELRTPLHAILGFAQLLELNPGGGGERQIGWTQQVLASGRHLLALVDDILELSSTQTGQQPFALEAMALAPVVQEALDMLARTAADAQVHVACEVPTSGLPAVLADRRRLRQILSNLLSNAIKYNHRGGWVRVSARSLPGALELAVQDSGPGMDAAQVARLFSPFERLGAERGPVAGTGLGLALSRQLAQAMGGGIEVESAPGQGSTFRVRLPAA